MLQNWCFCRELEQNVSSMFTNRKKRHKKRRRWRQYKEPSGKNDSKWEKSQNEEDIEVSRQKEKKDNKKILLKDREKDDGVLRRYSWLITFTCIARIHQCMPRIDESVARWYHVEILLIQEESLGILLQRITGDGPYVDENLTEISVSLGMKGKR